jgi:hypothetical protein
MSVPLPSLPSTVLGVAYPIVKHVLPIIEYVESQFHSSGPQASLRSLFLGALIAELQSLQSSTAPAA